MNSQPLAASRAPEKLTHPTAYLLRVVLIAFLLRVGGMFLIHSYRVNLENDEASHIAASLASGEGFSSPFGQHTGPTAWLGPVYPFVLSRIFVAFGTQTRAAIFAALLLNCLLSALTVIPVFFIAEYSFGLRIAKWSLWTWTLFPYAMYWGMRWIWDTALSALLLTLLFWFTLHLAQSSTLKKWVLYGLLWGLAGLTNTAELAFLPFAGIWICYQQFRQGKPFFRNAVVGAILFFAAVTPWIVRDYVVFHKFIPIRGNFGLEFHLGNTAEATGMWQVWLHPSQNLGEFHEYQRLGEIAYIHSKLEETLQSATPETFRIPAMRPFHVLLVGISACGGIFFYLPAQILLCFSRVRPGGLGIGFSVTPASPRSRAVFVVVVELSDNLLHNIRPRALSPSY